jgi:hypothetical protein
MYPDGTVALLNTYYRLMSEEITAHEGQEGRHFVASVDGAG